MQRIAFGLLAALALLAALPAANPARAETGACTVLEPPVVINTAGTYCLDRNWVKDYGYAAAVEIRTDDVILDCNDHRLRHANGANTQTAILVGTGLRTGITIRNCVLEGWYSGILVQGTNDPGANGNRIEDNVITGSRVTAITIIGSHNLIQGNRITGNTADYGGVARGIYVGTYDKTAIGNVIRDNVIADFKPLPPGSSATVEGMAISYQHGIEVRGNVISGLYNVDGSYTSGIVGYDTTEAVIVENTIVSPPVPWPAPYATGYMAWPVYLYGTAEEMAKNICRDNIIGHASSAGYGCTFVGTTGY